MAQMLTSSFVEVYKAAQSELTYLSSKSSLKQSTGVNTKPLPCTSIFDAIKQNSLNEVKRFLEIVGPHVLDENGHTVAHWAALLGLNDILLCLVAAGASLNVQSQHEMGQFPIHWACVNNHQYTVHLLVEHGAFLDQTDAQNATPLIVAARYGSLAVSAFLLARGANVMACNNDGDTALHMAAYGGFADLCRVLSYSGLSANLVDEFGQTPLHLACISGNLRTVIDLCRIDKVDKHLRDSKGKLPIDLARGRNFTPIVDFITNELKRKASKLSLKTIAYGPSGTRMPLLFFVFMILCWAYPMYFFKALPITWSTHPWIHILFWPCNFVMWLSFFHSNLANPNFLPRHTKEYDDVLQQVTRIPEKHVLLDRLCHSCRALRPLRTSHCRICDRCVVGFDHHCPYVDNCVGANNRHSFLILISTMFFINVLTFILIGLVLHAENYIFYWHYILGLLLVCAYSFIVIYVFTTVWRNALQNITTNERLRWRNYRYMRNSRGEFQNPFNMGAVINVIDFFHLRKNKPEENNEYVNLNKL